MTETVAGTRLEPRRVAEDFAAVVDTARLHAPYLARLLTRDGPSLNLQSEAAVAAQCDGLLAEAEALAHGAALEPELAGSRLRQFKRRLHLMLALLDLSGHWRQDEVTLRLSRFADLALQTALKAALATRGIAADGLFLFAFGKMGAFELNYSSDIDIAAFFDPERFDGGRDSAQETAIRVVRDLARLIEAPTGEGYVFRTDLRLRPDPSSTPVAVSTRRAEIYYESVGQNWERMAWIKARPCAGDLDAASEFHAQLEPFVWRRHLDYWALADIHAIKRMINARVGDRLDPGEPCDVKLGPGGIREIEFFVQTQQVILGGRDASLRARGTLDALGALEAIGAVSKDVGERLGVAYCAFRSLEHRIQMLNDDQTHTLPASAGVRAQVAALMGFPDADELAKALFATRRQVHDIYSDLFASEDAVDRSKVTGNLVFTGVDDDPGTLATLREIGFREPSRVIASLRRWHFGHVPATRSPRGQALLTAITPRLLHAMAETGEADTAFAHFERFFEGLTSGVQLLAMLNAENELLSDLVATLAIAPRLAQILGRRPALLESLIAPQGPSAFALEAGMDFETAMDAARRNHRDRSFLIGHAILNGRINARDAGAAWTALARDIVPVMAQAAERENLRRFGAVPGEYAIMGMGSLGAGEMCAVSDLDMLVIFDPATEAAGGGEAQTWFTRFTQRLIAALSAPTAEGLLYEVDMRLRPSGRAGPVAVRLSAFETYQFREAWTWEHMALTRMSFVAGDPALGARALEIARAAINDRLGRPGVSADIDDMRARLRAEKPARGLWDMKRSDGGLVDIEFLAQKGLLLTGGDGAIQPRTDAALAHLAGLGWLTPPAHAALSDAWTYQMCLRQVLRLALAEPTAGEAFSSALQSRLMRAVGAESFPALEAALTAHRQAVIAIA